MDSFKCSDCGSEFGSEQALQQHRQARHEAQKPAAKPLKSEWIYVLVIAAVIVIAAFYFFKPASPGKYDDFAKCLTSKGVKFYGAFWCPHCKAEKQLFGSSVQYVNYIECSTPDAQGQTPVCSTAGIQSYPTFEFADGSRLTGELTLQQLSDKTNCPLPSQ